MPFRCQAGRGIHILEPLPMSYVPTFQSNVILINVTQTLMTIVPQQILSAYYVRGTRMNVHLDIKIDSDLFLLNLHH